MKNCQFFSYVTFFFSIVCLTSGYLESDGWINIELHHSLDASNPSSTSYRGNITIPSLNSGLSNTVQESLSDVQRENLKDFSQRNKFYRLWATVVYANGARTTFLTSTRACNLLLAQLNDVLWVSIDGAGFVTSVTQTTSSGSDDCISSELSTSGLEDFNTDVLIRHMELAPVPDTASFIQKVEREREARERGEVRDNRGFLAKYICDPHLRILNVNARYPGARHDAYIWNACAARQVLKRAYERGERHTFLIGDSGYPLEPWMMTPLPNQPEGTPQFRYNRALCKARNCVERLFGVLKNRWRCLSRQRVLMYEPGFAGRIVNACAVLHNISLESMTIDAVALDEEQPVAEAEEGATRPSSIAKRIQDRLIAAYFAD